MENIPDLRQAITDNRHHLHTRYKINDLDRFIISPNLNGIKLVSYSMYYFSFKLDIFGIFNPYFQDKAIDNFDSRVFEYDGLLYICNIRRLDIDKKSYISLTFNIL